MITALRVAGAPVLLALALACAARLERPGLRDWEIPQEDRVALAAGALRAQVHQRTTLLGVSHRLRVAGESECAPNLTPLLGGIALRRSTFEGHPVLLRAASEAFELFEEPTILGIVPDSPLDRAGARVGDRILALGGRRLESDDELGTMLGEEAKSEGGVFAITLGREDQEIEREVEVVSGCNQPVYLDDRDEVLMRGSHRRIDIEPERWRVDIWVSRGLLDLTASEDELALVVAHLLAHGALETSADSKVAARRRKASRLAERVSLEQEADRMGLEIAARVGYDIAGAADFWERIAIEKPGLIDSGEHGYMGWRLGPMRAAMDEILARRARTPSEPLEHGGRTE